MSESQIDIDNRVAEAVIETCNFEREQRERKTLSK